MKQNNLQIEYVSIEILKPNEYNPKQMTEKEAKDLEKSIVEFGMVDPLIVNKAEEREGIIIGGHQRYKIYQKLGYEKVPVIWLDIPDLKKEQELCLRLSKNIGSWDYDLLANFQENLLKDVGFDDELDEIFGLDIADEFDIEKELEKVLAGKERRCKEGDLFGMGEYYICPNCKKEINGENMKEIICPHCQHKITPEIQFRHKLFIGDAVKKESWEKVLQDRKCPYCGHEN